MSVCYDGNRCSAKGHLFKTMSFQPVKALVIQVWTGFHCLGASLNGYHCGFLLLRSTTAIYKVIKNKFIINTQVVSIRWIAHCHPIYHNKTERPCLSRQISIHDFKKYRLFILKAGTTRRNSLIRRSAWMELPNLLTQLIKYYGFQLDHFPLIWGHCLMKNQPRRR